MGDYKAVLCSANVCFIITCFHFSKCGVVNNSESKSISRFLNFLGKKVKNKKDAYFSRGAHHIMDFDR